MEAVVGWSRRQLMGALLMAVDGGCGDDDVAAAVDKGQPLDFGGCRHRRLPPGRWGSSTMVKAIIVDSGDGGD